MTESEIKQITLTLDLVENSVKKFREIEKIKGENFNLFNILDRRTDEVKTHSAIIGELLNPKGSHYLDKTFLILFIEMLNRKKRTDNIWEKAITPKIEEIRNASVECEKSIGKVRDNTGGRLDLIISNDIFQICIENKIYAEEQDSQLERYKNFLERFPKSYNILIYLTLNGVESKTSKLVSGIDYYTLSYKYDIIEWLEKCFKETVDIPILRESIKQYLILIRSLTNQITTNEMKNEI
ncbi:MAG: PD-(D/E)XK nuclease family protein, partial [Salinivirgaceae bacterium]|nr:PD-(D/E)XK nuclease family protein [Salinivirgaceae bacterium]